MRADLADKYDLRVPRYTSYPTAPHFGPEVGPDLYAEWLANLPPDMPLSLYLHVLYCAEMCWFCACHVKISKQYAPIADYLECLWQEIDLVADQIGGRQRKVSHLHFGGGSPTILSPQDFVGTVDRLRRRFAFLTEAEIAVELDPRTANEDYIRAMATAGVTRASIGVQDFNPKVQQAINRIQPYEMTAGVIEWLRRHGIAGINMDLVYGLPYQTVESVLQMVDLAAGLAPQRIALFGYAHVPWMKKHQRLIPDAALPDISERWRQAEAASERLLSHGYEMIGLDHFARADDPMARAAKDANLHRNFQGYTTDLAPALIGFGASGIGALPQGYVANETDLHAYKKTIRAGRLATKRGIAIDDDDRLRRTIIERLMCGMAVDIDAICSEYDVDPGQFDGDLDALRPMQNDGLVIREGRSVRMTEQGRPLVRAAAAAFDSYLKPGEARHSKAV